MRHSEAPADKTVETTMDKNYNTQNDGSKDIKRTIIEGASRSGMGHSGTMNSNILMSLSRSPTSRSGDIPSPSAKESIKKVANFKNDKDNIQNLVNFSEG